jgi:hypothetical protein
LLFQKTLENLAHSAILNGIHFQEKPFVKDVAQIEDAWRPGHLDKVFREGGHWESSGGRKQTEGFARTFVRHMKIPMREFSLLDVGCALGDSLSVFRTAYPNSRLFGCDVSEVAIERCKAEHPYAEFFKAGFAELSGFWDVIYCSNVLEHFQDYKTAASCLISKCRIAYIMVPYFELKDGKPLAPNGYGQHQVTFRKDSFDFLYQQGLLASPVKTKIVRSPHFSPQLVTEIWREIRRAVKMAFHMRYIPPRDRQIIFELRNSSF